LTLVDRSADQQVLSAHVRVRPVLVVTVVTHFVTQAMPPSKDTWSLTRAHRGMRVRFDDEAKAGCRHDLTDSRGRMPSSCFVEQDVVRPE
jgi:hypothetical protein